MNEEFEASARPLDRCPACGGEDLVTEPAVDAEGLAIGTIVVRCDGCGRQVAELPAPEPSPEAEPELAEAPLLPGPDEEPRPPRGSGAHHPGVRR